MPLRLGRPELAGGRRDYKRKDVAADVALPDETDGDETDGDETAPEDSVEE